MDGIVRALTGDDGTDEPEFQLRVNVARGEFGFWEDTVFLLYSGERLLDDDIIEFVGTVTPLVTYKAIFGQTITIPGIRVIQAQRQ